MKILINCPMGKVHSTNWALPWKEYCENRGLEYHAADMLKELSPIELMRGFDCLLWNFGQYSYAEMLEARSLLYCARQMGLSVFPDFADCWHFDDKVAETYLLQTAGAPLPESHIFYDMESFERWSASNSVFPWVAKLRTGSGSHNVKLLKSTGELHRYAARMFGKGFNPAPSLLYKTSSNVRSSHDLATFVKKARRIPEFMRVLSSAKEFPNEHGYLYLQEFVPNNGFDMKVIVIGDKLYGVSRPVRSHDFRASGGGEVYSEKKHFTQDIIGSAFAVTDALGLQCMGYDYVINNKTGKGVIVEMSYGFSHTALMAGNGYFDRSGRWHEGAVNAPHEILENIIGSRKAKQEAL